MKIGYLGPKGTFSQEALQRYIFAKQQATANENSDQTKMDSFEQVDLPGIVEIFKAFERGDIEQAIFPIENSLEGAVNATMDILLREDHIILTDEILLPVTQNLLMKSGANPTNIRVISSHPQPIGQCRQYLSKKFPDAIIKYAYSTADSALEVANSDGSVASIGSVTAADAYELDIFEGNIQDGENNVTRFVMVGREERLCTGKDKTSIVFSTNDSPGSLYRILDIFNLWDINLTRIESRPSRNKLGEYVFFVDISGHKEEEDVKSALTMIRRKTSFYKMLGSYPAAEL